MVTYSDVRIVIAGLKDGWDQPYEVITSANVDRYVGDDDSYIEAYELLDRAMSVGQFARAGFRSEAWVKRYWPFHRKPKPPYPWESPWH